MCNLYSYSKPHDAARTLARIARDLTGNMPPLPAIFSNCRAPVVRNSGDTTLISLNHTRWFD